MKAEDCDSAKAGEKKSKPPKNTTPLTHKSIAAMKPGDVLSDPAPRGAGQLLVRIGANGKPSFQYRYTAPDGKSVRLSIGTGITLADARKTAHRLSVRYQAGERDLREAIEAQQREEARGRVAAKQAAEASNARQHSTLGALLTAYTDQLVRDKKKDARKVQGALQLHVCDAWPKLWQIPAADVTTDDLFCIVARLTEAGKLREAGKVCSYLKSAYASAIRARTDATALQALRDLRLTSNPARDLLVPSGGSKPGERALTLAELRAYWQRIETMQGARGGLLRFHLLTGCQRLEQLARLTAADYDADLNAIVLRDGKGRRAMPRVHVVPLLPLAADAMRAMGEGEYLFSVTVGETGADSSTVRKYVGKVAGAMRVAGELSGGNFTPKDLRRTVETRLAAAGVGKDIRAQLQSHGLGGVQDRHYDKHDYLAEKRHALETLERLLTGAEGKVIPIRNRQEVAQ